MDDRVRKENFLSATCDPEDGVSRLDFEVTPAVTREFHTKPHFLTVTFSDLDCLPCYFVFMKNF